MKRFRSSFVAAVAVLLVAIVAVAPAQAAGEEIVVERTGLFPTSPPQWIDPAAAYTTLAWQLGYATCLKLVNFDEETGVLGPDGAVALPIVSNLGATYTFTVAPGHRFSDGAAVDAASFKRGIERATAPAMVSSGGGGALGLVGDIVGASAHLSSGGGMSGVVASGNQLTINLTAPAGDFLSRITGQFFCATHPSAPAAFSTTPLPSAGPYYVDSADANQVVLKRNPYYGGSRIQNLGTIRWVPDDIPAVADYVPEATPAYVALATDQDVISPTGGIWKLTVNTSKAPFSSVDARRAVAHAVDRTAASSIRGWTATDQFLAPQMAGYQAASLFGLTPNVAAANGALALAGPPADLAIDLCHSGAPTSPNGLVAAGVKTQLQALAPPFVVTIKSITSGYFDNSPTGPGPANPANCDLALEGWAPDYPDPVAVLEPLFSGSSAANHSFFNGQDAAFAAARADVNYASRVAALGSLDVTLAGTNIPGVALGNINRRDVFSSRIGCLVLNPAYGYNLNRLCIEVEASAVPGGVPVSTGGDSSPASPLQTAVAVPSGGIGGAVTITQGVADTDAAPAYNLLEQQLEITAPAQQPGSPLVLTFELDATALAAAATTVTDVVVYRNGVSVQACATPAQPDPSPCVVSRASQPDGDGVIVVHALAASTWGFGVATYDVSGPFRPVDPLPAANKVTAGQAVPVKFSLGGNQGLGVIQPGFPSSTGGPCAGPPSSSPTTPNGAGLGYDMRSGVYTYNWKTSKSWAGHCRTLTVRFTDGQELVARFTFK